MENVYVFIHLETQDGEQRHDSKTVHRLQFKKGEDQDVGKWAQKYAAEFWQMPDDEKNDDEWFTFQCGCLATRVREYRIIKRSDYEVLKNYL